MFSPPFRRCPRAGPCDLDKASPFVRIHGSLSSSRELVPGDRKHNLHECETNTLREDKKAGYPDILPPQLWSSMCYVLPIPETMWIQLDCNGKQTALAFCVM